MSTIEAGPRQDTYALERTPEEVERLRMQARAWEAATGRLFDQVGLAPGARCLDAGCGPGETMRLMAQRVGPAGRVTGIDVDAPLGAQAIATLHEAGHRQCAFTPHDVAAAEPVPSGPFDLVHARLLLYHLPDRVAVLERLWDAVAPGGHLVVQDYDVDPAGPLPALASADACIEIAMAAFGAAGADVRVGLRLPDLFVQAGIGPPDGTDVAGRIEPLAIGRHLLAGVFRSTLPTALAHGLVTEEDAAARLAEFLADAERFPDRPMLWPLMIGAWKRRPAGEPSR